MLKPSDIIKLFFDIILQMRGHDDRAIKHLQLLPEQPVKLLAENRLDDLKRSVEDPAYQRKLLQEMENTK